MLKFASIWQSAGAPAAEPIRAHLRPYGTRFPPLTRLLVRIEGAAMGFEGDYSHNYATQPSFLLTSESGIKLALSLEVCRPNPIESDSSGACFAISPPFTSFYQRTRVTVGASIRRCCLGSRANDVTNDAYLSLVED